VARKATAQDVADLAGVSRSAVSLVLNRRGQGNIARDKQQAIIEAARQLNYTPNAVALSLRNQRSRTIGVLTWPGAGLRGAGAACDLADRDQCWLLVDLHGHANDRDHQSRALATLHDPSDLGLAIPTDLSIVSLDDGGQLASRLVPRLTTIERPDRAMAEQAVTTTLHRLEENTGGSNPQFSFNCPSASWDSVARPRRLQRRPCRPADRR
jgi:DNA-binding LacI/PurR family transcriptional regulator